MHALTSDVMAPTHQTVTLCRLQQLQEARNLMQCLLFKPQSPTSKRLTNRTSAMQTISNYTSRQSKGPRQQVLHPSTRVNNDHHNIQA
jgi:hypothetical protein